MKKIYIKIIYVFMAAMILSCKKKESDQLGIHLEDVCQQWELTSIKYKHGDTQRNYEFIPYYTINLNMLKGGRYEIDDIWGLLNMEPVNGTGIVSNDIQRKYGSWEFTNESRPNQIVFNKGANTYSLWTESGDHTFYTFSDPEYVFNIKAENGELKLTSRDYNLMYMYAFYLFRDDAYYYCPTCSVDDDYFDGYDVGSYYGYAAGYNNGALQAYNDSSKSIKVYRKDPFYNGVADGKLDYFYDNDYDVADLSATPLYEAGYNDGYNDEYVVGYNEGKNYADRLSTDPGEITLIFKAKQ